MENLVKVLGEIKGITNAQYEQTKKFESRRGGETKTEETKHLWAFTKHVYSYPQLRRIVKDVMKALNVHSMKKRQGGINGEIIFFETDVDGVEVSIFGYTDSKRRIGILSRAFKCQIQERREPQTYTRISYACPTK